MSVGFILLGTVAVLRFVNCDGSDIIIAEKDMTYFEALSYCNSNDAKLISPNEIEHIK